MAPGYRTATTTRRGNRSGYPEHDDFEGLPVRQWRLQEVDIAPPPISTSTQKNDRWSIELPYGMPKDFHLLPSHSQELLRAARSGALYKRKAPPDEEDAVEIIDGAGNAGAKLGGAGLVSDADRAGDKKAPTTSKADTGIKVKVWKRVAREAEAPSASLLAKRHKNTITLPSKASATQFSGPTVTRVTVRRVDAAGNSYERTITINDDDQLNHLNGEIVSTTVIAAPIAADLLAHQQPTPTRKRPPPPPHKKKHKGPGRGRKKKLGVGPLIPPPKPAALVNPGGGLDGAADLKAEPAGPEGIKQEDKSIGTPDIEMGENSAIASDEDDGEEDDGDDGEEGEANEEDGGNEGQGDDSVVDVTDQQTPDDRPDLEMEDPGEAADVVRPNSIEEPAEDDQPAEAETEIINTQQQPTNPLSLSAPHLGTSHLLSPRQHEGSPLKNVVLQSPTEPKSMDFPSISTVQEDHNTGSEDQSATMGAVQRTETVQQSSETKAAGLAMVEMSEQKTSVATESSMGDSSTATATEVKSSQASLSSTAPTSGTKTTSSSSQQSYQTTSTTHSLLPSLREPPNMSTAPAVPPLMHSRPAPEEGTLDLLGGLERELERQSRTSTNTPAENAAGNLPASESD